MPKCPRQRVVTVSAKIYHEHRVDNHRNVLSDAQQMKEAMTILAERAFPNDEDWYAHGVTDAENKSVERMRDGTTSYWHAMRRFDGVTLQLRSNEHPSVYVNLVVRYLETPEACTRAKYLIQRARHCLVAYKKCCADIDQLRDE